MNKNEKKINDLLKSEFEKDVPDIKSKVMQAAQKPDFAKYSDPELFATPADKNKNTRTSENDNTNYRVISSWFGRKLNLVATAVTICLVIGIVGFGFASRNFNQNAGNLAASGIGNLSAKNYDDVMTAVKKINNPNPLSVNNSSPQNWWDSFMQSIFGRKNNGVANDSVMIDGAPRAVSEFAMMPAPDTANMTGPAANAAGVQATGTNDISGTNNQVALVEEADIVKVDGDNLYAIVSGINSQNYYSEFLVIASIADPSQMKVLSKTLLGYSTSKSNEMYLADSKLTVISPFTKDVPKDNTGKPIAPTGSTSSSPSISTYATPRIPVQETSDMQYQTTSNMTKVTVYNISDKTNPTAERTFIQEGNYNSSRLIDNNLYTVSTKYIPYVQSNAEPNPDTVIPQVSVTGDNNFEKLPPDKIMIPNEPTQSVFTIVSGLDINDKNKEADTVSVLGSSGTIYSTRDNMYIASNSRHFMPEVMRASDAASSSKDSFSGLGDNISGTDILKFSLDKGNVTVKERTEVPGYILNQYSMDEYKGNLRVATTYYNPTQAVRGVAGTVYHDVVQTTESVLSVGANVNGLYVFDNALAFLGKVDNIAPTETIKSVRFSGDKGYMVTFRQMDPFFVIDLSNPANPKLQGELKIPGYSDYMHPYSDNLMIGIGYDADPNTGRNGNLKASLFDVSNPENPKEVSKYIFKEIDATSTVTSDPKAFLFSKEKNIIGFPLSYSNDNTYTSATFAYAVMGVDEANKQIYLEGKVVQSTYNTNGISEPANSYNPVLRGCYVGNTLFTVTNINIKSTTLDNFAEISTLSIK